MEYRLRKRLITRLSFRGIALFLILGLSGGMIFASLNEVRTYYDLTMEIKANTELLEKTRQEQETLENTKKNLTNPDYLEFVARGRYHVSRDGEQVFVFPALSETDEDAASLNESLQPEAQAENLPEQAEEGQNPQQEQPAQ